MAKQRYAAAGGVVIQDGRMLLLERPERGEVRLPKGHIDPGEAAAETAVRETAEESGYDDLAIVADLGTQVVEFDYKGNHYIRQETYYLLRLRSDRTMVRSRKDEAQFFPLWVPLNEAPEQLTFAAEQEVARRAVRAYESLVGG
jgi:8-oxo-dGTP pyrophosphatase MutT (NUDIX family)